MTEIENCIDQYLPTLTAKEKSAFSLYYRHLADWNTRINLTSVIEPREVCIKHFADSLSALPFLEDGSRVLDVGCGAGLPSIPLKIVNPTLTFTLVDSVEKKLAFVREVISVLHLGGIGCLHSRAEDLTERGYDAVVARAVAPLAVLAEYTLPFLRIGGIFIAYKALGVDEEIAQADRALSVLGGTVEDVRTVALPDCDMTRKLILVKKTAPTPAGYPRGKNLPRLKTL